MNIGKPKLQQNWEFKNKIFEKFLTFVSALAIQNNSLQMLTRNQVESELSLAYLQAVAARMTFAVDVPRVDSDSVDAVISAKGRIDASSLRASPRIEVQLKATMQALVQQEDKLSYKLTLKNYDDLRADTLLPRLLILLVLPQDETIWLLHEPERLILQGSAYYVSLKGLPASNNAGHQTIYVPVANQLTPDVLRILMIKASKLEDL